MSSTHNRLPIEVVAVTKTYPGGIHALREASFRIQPGERACLLGPNGAGKTTMIRLLTGALQPTGGAARIFGIDAREPEFLQAKRRVGIVPQSPGMYRDIKVGEYLHFVQQLYDRGNVAEIVEVFGLAEFMDRPMAALSGGYQRRLALAAALLSGPDLLLLDEPTVGLDPVAAREVHDYLRTMIAGRTVLLCTHNLAEAEALCESVVILRGGQVLLHETITTLRRRAQPHVVLAAQQGPAALAQAITALGFTPQVFDSNVHVPIVDPQRHVPPLLRGLLGSGLDVYECHIIEPSLEDLFLEIVGNNHAGT